MKSLRAPDVGTSVSAAAPMQTIRRLACESTNTIQHCSISQRNNDALTWRWHNQPSHSPTGVCSSGHRISCTGDTSTSTATSSCSQTGSSWLSSCRCGRGYCGSTGSGCGWTGLNSRLRTTCWSGRICGIEGMRNVRGVGWSSQRWAKTKLRFKAVQNCEHPIPRRFQFVWNVRLKNR